MYQAGFFPIMMFGLPAAALAIYHSADKVNRSKVFSVMLAAGAASFFTGITEPLEFSFMFLAPALYLIHAVLTGISLWFAAQMGWMSGFGFSAGFVDFVLGTRNPLATQWYMLIVQGAVFAVVYYFVFRFAIAKFNLKTLGRGEVMGEENESSDEQLAAQYIKFLGGDDNIVSIDNCITRLRLQLKDSKAVNIDELKKLGAAGVVVMGETTVQVIVGVGKVDKVATAMKQIHKH